MRFVTLTLAAMMAIMAMPLCLARMDTVVVEKLPEVVFEAGSPIRSALVTEGGRLFFGSADRRFRAIDTAMGEALWSYTASDAVESQPVVTGGRVIFNAANTLYILDATSGAQIHKAVYSTDATTRVSDDHYAYNDSGVAVSDDGIAFFAALNGDIVGVEIDSGKVVCVFPSPAAGEVASGVVLDGGSLYWVDHDGALCSVDVAGWRLDFRTEIGDRVFAPMLIDRGRVFLGGRGCRMWCVDATGGAVLWSSYSADPTTWFSGGSVMVGDTLWAATSDEHTMLLLDAATGEFRGLLPTVTNAYTRPVVHGDEVIVAATDVYILDGPDRRSDITGFDARSGAVLWRTTLDDSVLSSPVVADDALWVASESGRIYRFAL